MAATVEPLPNRGLTVAEVDDLRTAVHQVELALATLTGEVKALRELKAQDHQHLSDQLREVDHKRRSTDATVTALHNRIDEYPAPSKVTETVEGFSELKNRLIGAIVAGMALGVGGGTAVGQLIGG